MRFGIPPKATSGVTRRVLLAMLAAAAAPVPDGFRLDDYRAPVPDTVPGASVVHAAEIQALIAIGGAVLIDVLPAPRRPDTMRPGSPWIPRPHLSLPGALWWPEIGRGALPPATEARLLERLHEVVGDGLVVFFCLPECWMSWNATRRAVTMGFHAAWFPEGTEGWHAAGHDLVPVTPETIE